MLKAKIQKIKNFNFKLSQISFIAIYSLFNLFILNFFFWTKTFKDFHLDFEGITLGATLMLIAFGMFFLFFSLLFNKYTLKTLSIFFVICSGMSLYFIFQYGIPIDKGMLINVMQTDTKEAKALLNHKMLIHILLFIIIPTYLIVKTKIKYQKFSKEFLRRLVICSIITVVTLTATALQYRRVATFIRENKPNMGYLVPNNYINSVVKIVKMQFKKDDKIFPVDLEASFQDKNQKTLVVLVIGETARAKNFSLYKYDRETNPLLKKQDVVVLENSTSCGTSTAASLPCIFSFLGREGYTRSSKKYEPLASFVAKFKIDVLWRGNNSGGCKGMCDNVPTQYFMNSTDPKYCIEDGCIDEIMLPGLGDYIKKQTNNSMVVLHQNGSHGPRYNQRYPKEFEIFKPVCKRSDVSKCSQEELVNAYDNTIVYTDHFLNEVIKEIKANAKIPAVMIYVSDHGESLGENGIYLHGFPYNFAPKEQKEIPFIIWASDSFKKQHKFDKSCYNKNGKSYSHDNVFHSVIGIFGINSKVYNQSLDLFNPENCK